MEKYLFFALVSAFSAYAARVGLALAAYNKRYFVITVIGYGFAFILAGLLFQFLTKNLGLSFTLLGKAVYFHVLIALGLLLWAIFAYEHRNMGKVLLFPCPFCLITIVFTLYALRQLTNFSFVFLVGFSFSIFLFVIAFFYFLGRLFHINIGELMLGVGIYYLLLIGTSRYYAETKRVYAMVKHIGLQFPDGIWFFLIFMLVIVIFGFYKGRDLGC